ncbi:MAG: hypothetical protein KDF59_08070 [Nitrosomonas sp.]|nr:hypothetical protein [Nitrosomonas sp.]
MHQPGYEQFTCNLCGSISSVSQDFYREGGACSHCGSNVRFRALMYALSDHLYGKPLALTDFIANKDFKAMGLSDAKHYAVKLAELFDYTNFFYHTEPFLDICNIDNSANNYYDLLVSSDVYEHVPPPRHIAFINSWHLLKPDGVLLLTVPYTSLPKTIEHYPTLYQYKIVSDEKGKLLVNRLRDLSFEVYDNLTWHGGEGSTLEMRIFCESDLLKILIDAGFKDVKIWNEDIPEFGIFQAHQGGGFVITAKKNGNAIPAPLTQHDPHLTNIYPQGETAGHFSKHIPNRISGKRAERAIAKWAEEEGITINKPSFFSKVLNYLKGR